MTFNLRKMRPVIANVVVVRELSGWCWSPAVSDDRIPNRPEHSEDEAPARSTPSGRLVLAPTDKHPLRTS